MPAPYVQGERLVTLSFRVNLRDEARIRAQAAREHRTPTQLIRGATLDYLDRAANQTEQETTG